MAREDRRKAERKEKYRKMLQTAKDSEDLNSMREAKVWFEAQGDYQDSKALAKHCASRIVDLEQKALEAEKAAIAERIRQQEIARREAAKKEKKQRMFGIAAVCAAIAAVLLTLLINKIQYQKDFEAAIVLYESGEYQQAADAFGQLDGAEAEEYQSACLDLLEKQQAELAAQKAEAEAKKAEAEAKKAFEATVAEATALEANGDIIGAAMLYGSLTDHPEYMDKSLELWNQFARRKTIAAGNGTTLAVTNQGNVLYTGYTKAGLAQVSKWSGIIAVDAAEHYVLGLCSDGSVMYVGLQNKNPRIAGSWKGIVDIAAGSTYAAGLKADGTVVVTDSSYDVSDWTGIVDVFVGYENVYGLKADGTVVAAGNTSGLSVTHWWDVVEIVCEYEYAVKTHTTYSFAIGVNANGALFYCGKLPPEYEEIKLLTDVQSICVGSRPVVLKKNGTVTYIPGVNSSKYTFDSVRSWRNIVSISSTGTQVIGLRADGTLGASVENDYNQFDVSGWRDIRLP